MDYLVDDAALDAAAFLALANSVWPGEYDVEKTRQALGKTLNITAYHQGRLIGCLRILTDGCYFGTITEVLVVDTYYALPFGKIYGYVKDVNGKKYVVDGMLGIGEDKSTRM